MIAKLVKSRPVARFYYKGNHTHPVRRTVVIVESSTDIFTGYELREGSEIRQLKDAPIKSYRRDRIAKVKQLDRRRKLRKTSQNLEKTTLTRQSLQDLFFLGV